MVSSFYFSHFHAAHLCSPPLLADFLLWTTGDLVRVGCTSSTYCPLVIHINCEAQSVDDELLFFFLEFSCALDLVGM